MSEEEPGQEKTEKPSEKRLKDSRKKGQVARSKDFNAMIILLLTGVFLLTLGDGISAQLRDLMQQALVFDDRILKTTGSGFQRLYHLFIMGFLSVLPLLLIILFISMLAPILVGGWVFSAEAIAPKLSRLNLLKGLKRMVSVKGLFEMSKALVKFVLVVIVAGFMIKAELPKILALSTHSMDNAIREGLDIVVRSFLMICGSLILIAAVDVPYQWYEHMKQLKMSKQELKDEYKEMEGKPEVKAQIRRAQQDIARRRMMTEVPKANVIITNPTHYAVAIAYQQTGNRAPIVVAKGKDIIALQINKVAKAHNVPMVSVPPLARAIYFSTKLNQEVPRGLYIAVAQVLAYIFQLRDKQVLESAPALLQNVPIPDELRRDSEETTL